MSVLLCIVDLVLSSLFGLFFHLVCSCIYNYNLLFKTSFMNFISWLLITFSVSPLHGVNFKRGNKENPELKIANICVCTKKSFFPKNFNLGVDDLSYS